MKHASWGPRQAFERLVLSARMVCAACTLIGCDVGTGPAEDFVDVLIPASDRAASIAWSEETGELVYVVDASGEIRAVDYRTAARRLIVPTDLRGRVLGRNLRVVGAAVYYLFLPAGTDAPELRRQSLLTGANEIVLTNGVDAGFEVSPDGRFVLTVLGTDRVLTLVEPATGVERSLVAEALGNPSALQYMWWGPSGHSLVAMLGTAAGGPTRAAVVDLRTGRVTEQVLGGSGTPTLGPRIQIAWADDRTPVWVGESGGALVGFDLRTGETTDLGPISAAGYLSGTVVVSRDGTRLAYWRGQCVETKRSPFGSTSCVKSEVEVVVDRVGGGAPVTVYAATGTGYPALGNVGVPRFSPNGRHLMIAGVGGIGVLPLP